jgi:predicted nucleotidyltransferase component of viral defense system
MNRTSLASNKLLALSNRRYNRDLYDVHFLLSKGFPFDDEIIFHESKKSIKELMKYILTNVQTYYDTTTILHELSMVINDKQKARVKSHLLNETITLLEKYIASH